MEAAAPVWGGVRRGGTLYERQPWMRRAGELPQSDQDYFELLARCVFSAGLGARVVEVRWEGLKTAFADFDPLAVSLMGEDDVTRMLSDAGVIRNRRKIEAVVANAGRFLDVVAEFGSFTAFLRSVGGEEDLDRVQQAVGSRFAHMGPASAGLFLFSAGWRSRRAAARW
jgi:3-methyladenine DNA glycosylase Tag